MDTTSIPGLVVHDPEACKGQHCCVHNPSDHHMKDWPLNWRGDKGIMERICPHGVGHPDPDDLAHRHRVAQQRSAGKADSIYWLEDVNTSTIHGCDGCCSPGGREKLNAEPVEPPAPEPIRADFQKVIDNPGIWIVGDTNHPGASVPLVSQDGKLYAILKGQELDPTQFFDTAYVASGPHKT